MHQLIPSVKHRPQVTPGILLSMGAPPVRDSISRSCLVLNWPEREYSIIPKFDEIGCIPQVSVVGRGEPK